MTAFLFPGQGSQHSGMGKDLYADSRAARAVFDQAEKLLPAGFLNTVFNGSPEEVNNTRCAQPALLVVETAIAAHLNALGIHPSACAGHSLGEIPALVAAGVLAFEDAVRLTRERARLMSENVPEGGMAAVMGLSPEDIESALPEGVVVANYNGPAQTIISGSKAGLEQAAAALKTAGAKRVLPLAVSGPFHSPYMRPAAGQFQELLKEASFERPRVRFISSVSGMDETDPATIRELLSAQLYSPVRWTQTMQCLGGGAALEAGPGSVLQGLAKRIDGAPEVRPAGSLDRIAALTAG